MALERLYLDYNATSPLSHSVLDWLRRGDVLFANPSSQHSDGKASRKLVNEARAQLLQTFHKSDKDTKLFFHSGATEAIHTFAYSFSEMARLSGKDLLICYSKIDHPAVVSLSEKYFGSHVKFFELKRDKNLHYLHQENFEALKDKKDNNPELIILYHHLWVHNETGQISALSDLTLFKTIPDLYLHIDAVQSPGKIPDWRELSEGDVWSFSAHKFGALKGIGFSFFKSSLSFHPLIVGGAQQGNLRSGTENVQGIKSISLALKDLQQVDVEQNSLQRKKLVDVLRLELTGIGDLIDDEKVCSNTIYFFLNKLSSDIALALFDVNGIEISAGSACSSGAAKPSAVLLQKGLDAVSKNGLRLSMAFQVNEEDLNRLTDRLRPIFNKLRHF
ncbi:MAG: aminotransferase class V-fold PLP-dependent enzyme [Bacteriovoracaceae bacterium]|nr:aminotransferase class V-fold PLP-dependent enzyme [Bacteriovoracaceae bacterium]